MANPEPVIDFRARPNTPEFMKLHSGPQHAATWRKFGYPEVPAVSLEEFGAALTHNGIVKAVFLGRQQVTGGVITRGITNDYVADCCSRLSSLVGMAGVDPTTGPAAVVELERAARDLGLRGVSLDLDAKDGFYPDDPMLVPLLEKALELKLIVVFTMGPLVGRFSDPLAVDRVAERYPELTIVCSHGCYPQVTEFIALAYRRDNVYLEASIYEFLPGAEPFIAAADGLLRERVIYASAFPFNPLETIERFRQLPLSEESLRAVTYGNAARILGLA
jgi:uncharacterized protein